MSMIFAYVIYELPGKRTISGSDVEVSSKKKLREKHTQGQENNEGMIKSPQKKSV